MWTRLARGAQSLLRGGLRRSGCLRTHTLSAPSWRNVRGLSTWTTCPMLPTTPGSRVPLQQRLAVGGARRSMAAGTPVPDENGVIDFLLADIGEGIAECEVVQWMVQEGDHVQQFDTLCEVMSDKANVEITSRYDGEVVKIHYQEGEMAIVGKPLLSIQLEGDYASEFEGVAEGQAAAEDAETSQTGTADPVPAENAASRGRVLTSPVVRLLAKEHNIDLSSIQHLATGPQGNLTKGDLLAFIKRGGLSASGTPTPPPPPTPASATPTAPPPTPSVDVPPMPDSMSATGGQVTTERITGIQRVMVKTMTAAQTIPTFGYADEVVMDRLIDVRKAVNARLKRSNGELPWIRQSQGFPVHKTSFLPFILKASSLALLEYPVLNAHVNPDCSELLMHSSHNIAFAVDTPQGLLVPSIKDCQDKTVFEIAYEIQRLADMGREGRLTPHDLSGGTFALSNIGTIGGTYTRPILVVPQVCIGAIGKISVLPRYTPDEDGDHECPLTGQSMTVTPTSLMQVSWSADHRVIDGATMAKFSNLFKELLEEPELMLLNA